MIEQNRVPTLDFGNGAATTRRYTRAKVIDMALFTEGQPDLRCKSSLSRLTIEAVVPQGRREQGCQGRQFKSHH
jgi:hypothetical protein